MTKTSRFKRRLGWSLILIALTTALSLGGCQADKTPIVDVDGPTDPDPVTVDKSDPYLVLVNPASPLPEDQQPELKTAQGSFQMETKAADAMIQLLQAAMDDGIRLQIVSAYRSQAKQAQLFSAKVQEFLNKGYAQAEAEAKAATIVARPGTSEHNTGLAADVVTPEYLSLNNGFGDTPAAKWLVENCARFGFILRYPKDKQEVTGVIYEPWHFRYVGVKYAEQIMEQGLCLEEYLGD